MDFQPNHEVQNQLPTSFQRCNCDFKCTRCCSCDRWRCRRYCPVCWVESPYCEKHSVSNQTNHEEVYDVMTGCDRADSSQCHRQVAHTSVVPHLNNHKVLDDASHQVLTLEHLFTVNIFSDVPPDKFHISDVHDPESYQEVVVSKIPPAVLTISVPNSSATVFDTFRDLAFAIGFSSFLLFRHLLLTMVCLSSTLLSLVMFTHINSNRFPAKNHKKPDQQFFNNLYLSLILFLFRHQQAIAGSQCKENVDPDFHNSLFKFRYKLLKNC